MPLPPELNSQILDRFEEIIQLADELIPRMEQHADRHTHSHASTPNYGHLSEFQAIIVMTYTLTESVNGVSGIRAKLEERIELYEGYGNRVSALEHIMGTLRGLKNDYENGFLDNLEERVVANITSDYMAHVIETLTAGHSAEYDHAFAAVMCGAVLEDALRRLCDRQPEPIATVKDSGQPKRLNSLIADLKKANVFNALKADQLRAWSKTRNHAAHGELQEITRNDVEQMVNGVRDFLADYL